MNKNSQKNYIDINDLSILLADSRWNFDKYQMQIFEEIVYLCINDNFIQDVQKIRNYLNEKYPEMNIPAENNHQAEKIVRFLYINNYRKYKNLILSLIKKYHLVPKLYWEDKFLNLETYIDEEIEIAKDLEYKINKSDARLNAINKKLENYPLSLMDNIILKNSPFQTNDVFPFWNNPYFTRKPLEGLGMPMSIDRTNFATINIGLPAYAALSEMIDLLRKNFKNVQKFREKTLPIPAKKDYRKSGLRKSIDAYMMHIKNLKIEKIAMSVVIDSL